MSLVKTHPRTLSPLAHVLKEHRSTYILTQEQLASDLTIDVRTLRRWENGETVVHDVRELRRIATLLGTEPARLGISTSTYTSIPIEQVEETMAHIWDMIHTARSYEAHTLIENLIKDLHIQINREDPALLRQFAYALHLAGYVKSVVTRASEAHAALSYYHEMEKIARIIDDDTLLNIALTYEGDMYCRGGEVKKGILYLEAARDTTPQADMAARGNGIQLLGRAYLRQHRLGDFEHAMKEAEELAYKIEPEQSSTQGQYSLGTVYEEYGRSYANLNQTQQAMEYLDLAEKLLAPTKHWEILIKTARAMALIKYGEINSGIELAIESTKLCQEHGTIRLMERIYAIQKHLDRLNHKIGQAGTALREALDGPIEY